MADNIDIRDASGVTQVVGTDDISGVHYQRVKVTYGPDGQVIEVSPSNPLPSISVFRGSVRALAVTVGTSAVALPSSALSNRKIWIVVNLSNQVLYLGDSSVTTTTGFPIQPGAGWQLALGPEVTIYGICASGSNDIRILEVS